MSARLGALILFFGGGALGACGATDPGGPTGSGGTEPGSGGAIATTGGSSSGGTSSGGTAGERASGGQSTGGISNLAGADSGSGGALVGTSCEEEDEARCAGPNQRDIVDCEDGAWEVVRSCALGSQCDTDTGDCAPIVEACRDRDPGDHYCGPGNDVYECGADRVSTELSEACPGLCDADAAACVNDCAVEHGGCDPLVTCTPTEQGTACGACPSGYAGTGDTGCAPLLIEFASEDGTLNPAFWKETTTYLLSVPLRVETVTWSGASVEGAEITINDEPVFVGGAGWTSPTLAWGNNSFTIEVSRDGGLTTTYQVTVHRGIESRHKASNSGADDYFGEEVALSGDGSVLVVGAYGEASAVPNDPTDNSADVAGAVYVFRRASDTWAQEAYLKGLAPDEWDFFGGSVAVNFDGTVIAVGSSGEGGGTSDPSDDSLQSSGAVFVFRRSGNAWGSPTYLRPSLRYSTQNFGRSVALSGDGTTLAVGSSDDSAATGINGDASNTGAIFSGAAYVFTYAANVWSQQAYVKASNTGMSDGFGRYIALSSNGSTLVVGAPEEASLVVGNQNDNSGFAVGAVYVFARTGSNWAQTSYLKAPNPDDNDMFGQTIDVSGDGSTIVVGSSWEASASTTINGDATDDSAPRTGAAYVFVKSGVNWTHQAYLKASNAQAGDAFGMSASLSEDGNVLLVGAPREAGAEGGFNGDQSTNSRPNSGAVYAFRRAGSTWTQSTYVKASDPLSASFGYSVSLAADARFFAVGAYTHQGSGAVYAF